ncbi:hypothetical protein BS78_05G085800 [Paspalum vaginatum]|nr:hypothetical protein BS78_05G085800 [Paspalum vaginatum]
MSSNKRPRHDDDGAGGSGDQRSSMRRPKIKKHLYLVLNDGDKGYNIYEIDADIFDSDDHQQVADLPEPPVLRLENPAVGGRSMDFSALGTKIIALVHQRCCLVYDTETARLGVGPHAPLQMVCGSGGISVAVGGALYALTYRSFDPQQPMDFAAREWAPTGLDAMQRPTEGWSWKALPPPPFCKDWVTAYALHPDGCTNRVSPNRLATYSFNTKESAWRWHGERGLPFFGRAHYDDELDAWVGLARRDGHISCCQVVSPTYYQQRAPGTYLADFKSTKFWEGPGWRRETSLTPMGTSRYCLVQQCNYDHGCVLHVTIFGLKYNHKGELQTTRQQSTRSFSLSRRSGSFAGFAFWM